MVEAVNGLVITGAVPGVAMVITSVLVSVPQLLSAVSVTLKVPAAVGLPLIVDPLKVNPPGRPVAL